MKRLEYLFNFIYYYFFIGFRNLNRFTDKIFFFKQLYNSKLVRKRATKWNIKDPYKTASQIAENPKNGWVVWYASILMFVWISLLFWGLFSVANYIDHRIYKAIFQSKNDVIKIGIPMLLFICYLFWQFIEKRDKYLTYFQQFEQRDKQTKRKDTIIAILIIVGGLLFYILPLLLIGKK